MTLDDFDDDTYNPQYSAQGFYFEGLDEQYVAAQMLNVMLNRKAVLLMCHSILSFTFSHQSSLKLDE